jgi:hypothetical protein
MPVNTVHCPAAHYSDIHSIPLITSPSMAAVPSAASHTKPASAVREYSKLRWKEVTAGWKLLHEEELHNL